MAKKYKEFSSLNLPEIEKEMLSQWQQQQAFEKSISLREGAKTFVFYEGPPSANGMPGIHHVISRTIKDMVCRYKTMKGFQVQRKGGWDTHGLPVELGVEKELGITKEDIGTGKKDKFGNEVTVEYYNQKCREAVLRYKDKWDELTTKMGYWVDLKNPYITFENNYIETLWWLLKKLYDKGLLYESISIQPYSPAAGTGLSSHELNQPGTYKDVKDTSATVMFQIVNESFVNKPFMQGLNFNDLVSNDFYFMAWTTTPWTLPSNLGLTVGANIDYLLVQTKNPYTEADQNVVVAKALFHKYFENPLNLSLEEGDAEIFENSDNKKKHFGWKILKTFKGKDLEGVAYHQLMPYEANQTDNPNAFKVMLGDFVTTEDGTGIVHTAPAFGADDYKVGQKYGIGILIMVDKEGKFIDGLGEFSGRYVKDYKDDPDYQDVNVDICVKLKKENKAFKVEKYEHNYPHCWRTDKPILYYPLDAWFIKTTALKDRMVELNKTINWKPKSTGEGRFGNWLENMVDWNLSRSRFWGTPLPVWRTEDKSEEICIGSVENLKKEIATTDEKLRSDFRIKNYDAEREMFLGLKAFQYQSQKKTDIEYAMCRTDIPNNFIHFLWGKEGDAAKDFQGGYGTSKIIAKRNWEADNIDEFKNQTTDEVFKGVAHCIAYGEKIREFGPEHAKRIELQTEDYIVVISEFLNHDEYNWLVTGFKKRKETDVADSDSELSGTTQIDPTLNRDDLGAVSESKVQYFSKSPLVQFNTNDLHKPYVDDIFLISSTGKIMQRVPDLVDVWFDSGAMPFAQWHFPFEHKEVFTDNYPADFICEGVDQTRGWFYTLHAISSLVKEDIIDELNNANLPTNNVDGRAYKTVVSNGLVLDKYGNKMSKRLGNTIDPFNTIDTYSADATRWYLMTNASPWDNLKFDLDGIKEVQRKFFGTLYNTYQFFALYANVDGFDFSEKYISVNERPEIDRWILSSLHSLIKTVTENLDNYEPTLAFRAVEEFLDEHLSNWYVRLCRRRFWKGEYEQDKIAAYQTLYECLETLVRLMAPLSPFFSDAIFRNLNAVTERFEVESAHHSDFPVANESYIDLPLEERMQLAQDLSSLILSLRKKENIIVRQPLQKVLIPVLDANMRTQLEKVEDLIKSETNIKEVEYITDAHGIIHKKIKADFKSLGKRLGAKMKKAASIIENFSQDDIASLEKNGLFKIDIDEEIIEITPADVIITAEDVPGWSVAGKGNLTVALDITISEALKQEGIARMFVNRVQNIRKEHKFELTDRIFVEIQDNEAIKSAIDSFYDYISSEILADELLLVKDLKNGTDIDINDTILKISVKKNS